MWISDKRTVAGEVVFPGEQNLKAGHIHFLARARDPGGWGLLVSRSLFLLPLCSKFLHDFLRLSLLSSSLSVTSFRSLLSSVWA